MLLRILSRLLFSLVALSYCSQSYADQSSSFISPVQRVQLQSGKPWPHNKYLVLAYHDVSDGAADQRFLAVRFSALNDQFAWLKNNGYHVISINDVQAAQSGHKDLPANAVMLTFDDGYSSFYKRVFPLLKAYHWPAILAPVGEWVSTPASQPVNFGGLITPREHFLNWSEIKEMSDSGLVEIAAHTYAEHKGITANPQGNSEPYAASRIYDKKTGRYETTAEFNQRVSIDIAKITERIKTTTGKSPRVWVWPYGAANGETIANAKKMGYRYFMSLDNGLADVKNNDNIPRMLIAGNPGLQAFSQSVSSVREAITQHIVHVDLDDVYDADKKQQDHNIDVLVQRIADLGVDTVFLQAFADPDGDGNIKSLYFPNRWLPTRADLFNHVAWQLNTRAHARVFAWMPVLAFQIKNTPQVLTYDPKTNKAVPDPHQYLRLSPFSADARLKITQIYEDLAAHATFDGILFHDDAFLTDYEDAGPDALQAYKKAGLPDSVREIRSNPELMHRWTRLKSRTLIDFTNSLMQSVRAIRGPQVKSARNIYALPILQPDSEDWFAQNLDDFLSNYNWTVPMAMPLMEGVTPDNSQAWLRKLVDTISSRPGALSRTIIELQATDWSKKPAQPVPDAELVGWIKLLQASGVQNYGYYPDNFLENQPALKNIRPVIANKWFPLP
ncbi:MULTISPECIES: poly-beta-1,6-N-acetyl-D-glucosamine N-deacetylase PgaB [Tatumella]|uniref:Poly-beta-1,6-N-acetyl-D-glucosamine N-deacetylase PgaB n=1 Tax=Tatumella punctata TaxID=399969 RepID=A0ABW1VQY9_9GAMM|nr:MULTISPECIES: poly-beta-1,6-N-acetyl-D-glucosamine N-deacetylase PgaB [unclassified Tatumella]MBS0856273.1 poly-beta-1,6-N-acetyl-D-glucosamine N-deacetylase PgaB [Tatumella sp. JGM16]MBS0913418.1 poly-beta-1,6-N-acetyl-D-glucosamine N-deacetylase PgaB [Tatumella sp. JGM91]